MDKTVKAKTHIGYRDPDTGEMKELEFPPPIEEVPLQTKQGKYLRLIWINLIALEMLAPPDAVKKAQDLVDDFCRRMDNAPTKIIYQEDDSVIN